MVARRIIQVEDNHPERSSILAKTIFALLFVAWVGEWSLDLDAVMYNGLWRSPFIMFSPLFEPVPGIRLFTWQLLLLALAPICLASAGAFQHRARELDHVIFFSVLCVFTTFAWGWLRGGSPYFAYFQVWRWLAGLLVAFMLMSVVRSPRDLAILGKLIIVAALIRATLCSYFYWAHVRGKGYNLEYMTNHDDTVIFVTAVLVVGCWALVKGGRAAWTTAIVVTVYLCYAMVLNDRRIAWVEMVLAFAAVYVLLGAGPLRRQVNRWMMLGAPLMLLYIAIGLTSDAAIFSPIHSIASARSGADLSSLARQEEIRNLLYTLSDFGNPLLGTGWGHPYQKLSSLWSSFGSAWLLADYTPHNSLLGSVAFAGLLGLLGIWGVIPVAALLAARGYRGATEPIPRTASMVAIGALAVYSVHCYGDVGFSSFTASLFFGAALATAGKVSVWSATVRETDEATASVSDGSKQLPEGLSARYRPRGAVRRRLFIGRESSASGESPNNVERGRMPIRRYPNR
jgi:hypothetical protein